MILINEPYTLKPEKIRAGENILNTITTYGGYRTNIQINNDGTGEIGFNNSDYTISLNNDLIVGGTSTFTISNVTNDDTVEFYEDTVLISSTTGNTVTYTPTTAGEHLIYFRINNTPTTPRKVTVYTVNTFNEELIGVKTINEVNYIYAGGINLRVKPVVVEGETLDNILCTVEYGDRTIKYSVSSNGKTIAIPPLNQRISDSPGPLKISIAGVSHTIPNVKEYYDIYLKDSQNNYILDLRNIRVTGDVTPTNNGLVLSHDGGIDLSITEYLSTFQMRFVFGSSSTLRFRTDGGSTVDVPFNQGQVMDIRKTNGSVTVMRNNSTVATIFDSHMLWVHINKAGILFTRILTGAY